MIKNDINLLARYYESNKEKSTKYTAGKIYLVVILVVFLFLAAGSIKLILDRGILRTDVSELQAYVTSPAIRSQLDEITLIQSNLRDLDEMITQVGSVNEVLKFALRFDSDTLRVITDNIPSGVEFQNVSFREGEINIIVSGPRASDASNYVLRLQRTNYFASVTYSGYTFDPIKEMYTTTIRLVMKGRY